MEEFVDTLGEHKNDPAADQHTLVLDIRPHLSASAAAPVETGFENLEIGLVFKRDQLYCMGTFADKNRVASDPFQILPAVQGQNNIFRAVFQPDFDGSGIGK
ncbi:MAG: hypothetical protein U5K27_02850 [Desulfotignum sp.]|nr:hypothetical protein [Desulfotignum sp.]